MPHDSKLDALLVQYQECCEEIRHLDNLIWQIPSIAMAINSFFGLAYIGYAETTEARFVLLYAAFAFNLVSIITLRKHRFLQIARTDDMIWVQDTLDKLVSIRKLKWQTRYILKDKTQYPDVPRDKMISFSAYRWLLGVLCLTVIIISTVILFESLIYWKIIPRW